MKNVTGIFIKREPRTRLEKRVFENEKNKFIPELAKIEKGFLDIIRTTTVLDLPDKLKESNHKFNMVASKHTQFLGITLNYLNEKYGQTIDTFKNIKIKPIKTLHGKRVLEAVKDSKASNNIAKLRLIEHKRKPQE